MAQETDYEHQFLDLKGDGLDDRSFFGRIRTSMRSSLFLTLAIIVTAVIGGVCFYVDQRLTTAINELRHAGDIRILAGRVELGLAHVEKLEKILILKNTAVNREKFSVAIANIEKTLDNLGGFSKTSSLRQHMATLRDGIAQYNQQILKSEGGGKTILKNTNEPRRFHEIISYIEPSLDYIVSYSANLWTKSVGRVDQNIAFSRYTIGGASVGLLLWLIFWGVLLLKSMAQPMMALAESATRIASGERSTPIPIRGNTDASGQIARALDKWVQDLAELETLRRELQELQLGIEQVAHRADDQMQTTVDTAKGMTNVELDTPQTASAAETPGDTALTLTTKGMQPLSGPAVNYVYEGNGVGGPISSVSQQLSHFSEYVSVAANDVERIEALVRSLGEAASNIEVLGNLVTAVRDQVNSLGFRLSPRSDSSQNSENLISFNKNDGQQARGVDRSEAADRLDAIGDTMERAERTLQGVKLSVNSISGMAQEMAVTASRQAVEATNKLQAQSQYLRNMLDDIMARIDTSNLDGQQSPELTRGHTLPPKGT